MQTLTYCYTNMISRALILLVLSSAAVSQEQPLDDTIRTDSQTRSSVSTRTDTTLRSPPASAITPTINTSNSDLCTFGVAGAIQTQILGIVQELK